MLSRAIGWCSWNFWIKKSSEKIIWQGYICTVSSLKNLCSGNNLVHVFKIKYGQQIVQNARYKQTFYELKLEQIDIYFLFCSCQSFKYPLCTNTTKTVFVTLIDWGASHWNVCILICIFRYCLFRNGRVKRKYKGIIKSVKNGISKRKKKPYKNTFIYIMTKQKMEYYIKWLDIKNNLENDHVRG